LAFFQSTFLLVYFHQLVGEEAAAAKSGARLRLGVGVRHKNSKLYLNYVIPPIAMHYAHCTPFSIS